MSGLDPLPQQLPLRVAGEDGVGCQGLWYFPVMGALMPCAPLAKASWHGSLPTRLGLEKQLFFQQSWGVNAPL